MSEEQANSIAMAIGIPALVVILVAVFGSLIGLPRWVLRRRYRGQLAKLERVASAPSSGDRLEIEWMRYKELPKSQILAVLGRHGWHYHDQCYENRSWLLYFSRHPDPNVPTALDRLEHELTTTPHEEHHLDTTMYLDLDLTEIERTVQALGWHEKERIPETLGPRLVLTRPD